MAAACGVVPHESADRKMVGKMGGRRRAAGATVKGFSHKGSGGGAERGFTSGKWRATTLMSAL